VQKYLTISNHLCALGTVVVGKDFYDQSSDDLKAAIDKASVTAEAYINSDIKTSEKALYDQLTEKMEIHELSEEEIGAFQSAAKSAWPEIKEIIGKDYFNQVTEAAGIKQ
jgi:TRAP-type C4-dicarboxylate transport system substrate-binding protein